jgi:hypothetical protein
MEKTIYTIKLTNQKAFRYELIRFCETHNISTFLTWQEEDIFTNTLFVDVVVPDEHKVRFETKYKIAITKTEPFKL